MLDRGVQSMAQATPPLARPSPATGPTVLADKAGSPMMNGLSPSTFQAITDLFRSISGIRLTEAKHALVQGRLQKMVLDRGFNGDVEQLALQVVQGGLPDDWLVDLVDRLTTNETYFFREPRHFDDLAVRARAAAVHEEFRVWSAASSSGEEAYSIAMVLAESIGLQRAWSIHGTDLSSTMVATARTGLYRLARTENIPPNCLKHHCRRGFGPYEGHLLIARELRERVRFELANLTHDLPESLPHFDVIFLRNVLIYFDAPKKRAIVERVLRRLKPKGVLYTGMAETLSGLDLPVRCLSPAVYTLDA